MPVSTAVSGVQGDVSGSSLSDDLFRSNSVPESGWKEQDVANKVELTENKQNEIVDQDWDEHSSDSVDVFGSLANKEEQRHKAVPLHRVSFMSVSTGSLRMEFAMRLVELLNGMRLDDEVGGCGDC